MYKEIRNEFPALQSDIEKAFDLYRIHDHSRVLMERVGQSFEKSLQNELPDGEDGPPGQPRPSLRLWGATLKESFDETTTSVDTGSSSIGFAVPFNHPSVDDSKEGDVLSWFQFGTKPHRVPTSETKVVFWWGSPLKWPQYGGKPGVRSSTRARQWGIATERRGYWARPYGNFVGMAMDRTQDEEEGAVDIIYQQSITRPLDASNYLRRVS